MTTDQPYIFEFSSRGFVIEDRETRKLIAAAQRRGDLYSLHSEMKEVYFSNRSLVTSDEVWHQRLGQPQMSVVDFLKKNKLISGTSSNKIKSICSRCQMEKS